jgi:hypothetical protein
MMELSESGRAVASARDEIVRMLASSDHSGPFLSPNDLIRELAQDRDRDPYRAAVTSLLASGVIEATPDWKLRLRPPCD